MPETKAYLTTFAVGYDGENDQIVVRFGRGRRNAQTQAIEVDVTCELSLRERLWRILLMDNKHLRLAKVLEQFNPVPLPDRPAWGVITYDVGARVAAIYCDAAENAPQPGEALHANRPAHLALEGERLLSLRIPAAPATRRDHDLGVAAAQLPVLDRRPARKKSNGRRLPLPEIEDDEE